MRIGGTTPQDIVMNNPFWQASSVNLFEPFALYGQSDFYPEDGWELIKADFGKLADHSTSRNSIPSMTYFCLYNKYSGIMRFFGAIPDAPESYEVIKWKIKLLQFRRGTTNFSTPNLAATNLLSIQGETIATLEKPTSENILEIVTSFPGVSRGSYFFWFDVPVAYDPCVCYNNTAIEMTGELIKTATFTATGDLIGTIQEVKTPSTSNYSQLVAKRVFGAAVALGIAVATDGQIVQTSKFIDLIDLVTRNPNTDADTKKNFEMFKKVLDASNTLLRKDDKWVDWVTGDTLTDKQVTTILSSLNTYMTATADLTGTGSAAKSVTTVKGKITMQGSVTQSDPVPQSPYWAVPGSDWAVSCEQEVSNYNSSGEKKPEYPLYNEPLGTFAFLKAPKMKINITRTWEYSENQFQWVPNPNDPLNNMKNYWSCDGFKIEGFMPEDLLYTVNPKLNINASKTKITVAMLID